jgi:hypothetical protein
MRFIFTTVLLVIFSFLSGSAQITFEKTYGLDSLDIGYSVKPTFDGGYIIGGFTRNHQGGFGHAYVIRLNAMGDTLWTKIYGLQYFYTIANSVQQTNDGGFIIAGYAQTYNGIAGLYLIKTDENGDTLWTKIATNGMDVAEGYAVRQTNDGGFVACGFTGGLYSDTAQVYVIKTDANGNEQWSGSYGGTSNEIGYDIIQCNDDGYIIVGYSEKPGIEDYDCYIVKMDSLGNEVWEKRYGDSKNQYGRAIEQTADGGYAILGSYEKMVVNQLKTYFYLIKTDANGDTLWTQKYQNNQNCAYYDLDPGCDGGYILAGAKTEPSLPSDLYLIKTDDQGNILWSQTFGGAWSDGGCSVATTIDGYIVTGFSDVVGAGDAGYDVYAIKVDKYGIATNVPSPGSKNKSVSISPNPFHQNTLIQCNSQESLDFSLHNSYGKLIVFKKNVQQQFILEKNNLASGIYYYTIGSVTGTSVTGKLIIE